jgi:Uma2 family endonuclease
MLRQQWAAINRLSLPELLRHLGDISAARVRHDPPPGRATAKDLLELDAHEDCLCELIDGVLVEKVSTFYESILAVRIASAFHDWNEPRNAGLVTGASAPFGFGPRLVRMPDVAFTSWDRLPRGFPRAAVPRLVPDVAVEILNPGNTKGELARKLSDYFTAGVRSVWFVEPHHQLIKVYSSTTRMKRLSANDVISGGVVLPGFTLLVAKVFEKRAPARKPGN